MAGLVRLKRKDFALYWAPLPAGNAGERRWDAPIVVRCRWEDRITETINDDGRVVIAKVQVYPDRALAVEGVLWKVPEEDLVAGAVPDDLSPLVDVTDPMKNAGAGTILGTEDVPNARYKKRLYVATC